MTTPPFRALSPILWRHGARVPGSTRDVPADPPLALTFNRATSTT